MRKLTLTIALVLLGIALFAQQPISIYMENKSNNLLTSIPIKQQFLDSTFQAGKISFKDGTTSSAYFNYNIISNGIYFIGDQNKAYMVDGLPKILLISYGKRTFMPITNKSVVEVVAQYKNGDVLLLQRQSKIINSRQNRGPYGTSTETTSVDRVEVLEDMGSHANIDQKMDVNIIPSYTFYILRDNKRVPIRNFKVLQKLYPDNWVVINQRITEKKPKLSNYNDVVSLINYCNI